MEISNNQKFILVIKNADWLFYNHKAVSLKEYIASFSKIMKEKGYTLSYTIRSKGIDWMTLETENFPAALIIAIFASPLQIGLDEKPYFVVGNRNCAFSNNQSLKFYIPDFQNAFRHMTDIWNVLSREGKKVTDTEVVQIKSLNPQNMPIELPQCLIGNPGIYNDGAVISNSILNAHLSEAIIKIKDPIDEAFYKPVWEALNKIYSASVNSSTNSDDDDDEDDFFDPDFDISESES